MSFDTVLIWLTWLTPPFINWTYLDLKTQMGFLPSWYCLYVKSHWTSARRGDEWVVNNDTTTGTNTWHAYRLPKLTYFTLILRWYVVQGEAVLSAEYGGLLCTQFMRNCGLAKLIIEILTYSSYLTYYCVSALVKL